MDQWEGHHAGRRNCLGEVGSFGVSLCPPLDEVANMVSLFHNVLPSGGTWTLCIFFLHIKVYCILISMSGEKSLDNPITRSHN